MHHRKGFMNRRKEPLFRMRICIEGQKMKPKTVWLTKSQVLQILTRMGGKPDGEC